MWHWKITAAWLFWFVPMFKLGNVEIWAFSVTSHKSGPEAWGLYACPCHTQDAVAVTDLPVYGQVWSSIPRAVTPTAGGVGVLPVFLLFKNVVHFFQWLFHNDLKEAEFESEFWFSSKHSLKKQGKKTLAVHFKGGAGFLALINCLCWVEFIFIKTRSRGTFGEVGTRFLYAFLSQRIKFQKSGSSSDIWLCCWCCFLPGPEVAILSLFCHPVNPHFTTTSPESSAPTWIFPRVSRSFLRCLSHCWSLWNLHSSLFLSQIFIENSFLTLATHVLGASTT